MPQNNRLVRAWLPGSFMEEKLGEVKKQSKKTSQSLQMCHRNGKPWAGKCVPVTSLHSFTGEQLRLSP